MEELSRNMQHLYFKDPRVKSKVNEIGREIWIASHPTQTRKKSKKRKQIDETPVLDEEYVFALEVSKELIAK